MKLKMRLRHWTPVALLSGCLLPTLLYAQTPSLSDPQKAPDNTAVGGKISVDLVFAQEGALGLPLRHGAIIPGSEVVTLDGKRLVKGTEYSLDTDAGVIYLLTPFRAGQAVSVNYRYDPVKAAASAAAGPQGAGLVPFRLDFGRGSSLGFTLGMGLAERGADGSVMSTNIFGWSNSFQLGNSSLNGLMLVGDRKQQTAKSAFEYQGNSIAPGQGKSHLIMQSLGGNLGGGTFKFDFQDVSKNFAGFSAVTGNGYSQNIANQLSKEKGLKRMGFTTDKVQLGSLGFSNSYRSVGDEKGGITWQNYAINSGSLSLNYSSQNVGKNFDRFQDIAEANRDQLAREAGISRKSMDANWKLGAGALSYSQSSISDALSKGIKRNEIKFTGSRFNFDSGTQDVESNFTRIGSLNDAQAGQWGRELGLKRRWLSFDSAALGTKDQPLKFSQSSIDSTTGGMKNLDAGIGGKNWSLEHIQRDVDAGFTALPNLTPQEINDNIAAISRMYVQKGLPVTPDMNGTYFQSPGLNRDFTRFTFNLNPRWNLDLESLSLQGKHDDATLNNFTINGGGVGLSYRHENLGPNFSMLTSLLPFEQQRLGTIPGLDRTDLNFNADLRKGAKLSFGQTDASIAAGDFLRQTFGYSDRSLQLNVNKRNVGAGFTSVGQMLDPEAGMLSQMIGFRETDAQMKWQMNPHFRIEAASWSGTNDVLDQHRNLSNMLINWGPTKATQLEFQRSSSDSNNPFDALLANILQRMSLTQNLGKAGTLKFTQQDMQYDPTISTLPDSKMTDLSYETKLTDKTSVKTEQINTSYADGTHQQVQSNTINTELSKKAGVSLTDISVDNPGTTPDEHKRSMGFWMNLWGNVKLNYGVNDALNSGGSSVTQHMLSLTPGSVGNMQVGQASYAANSWEQGDRTQSLSNLSLSTVKPFRIGFLSDLKMNIGQDTAADNGVWLKENKTLGFSGRIGHNTFGYSYLGQMNAQHQRGTDRTFTFATDKSDTSKLSANLMYKLRSLPGDQHIAMRNFSVTARPWKGFNLTNEILTNPETPRGDLLLGSLPQPTRVNRWKIEDSRNPNFKVAGSWEEQRNDDTNAMTRLGGVTFTMFEKSGSPVSLFLGVERAGGNVPDRLTNRWSLAYTERPGPNQALSLFVGNVTYGGVLAPGVKHTNLSVDFQYQFRFNSK